MPNAHRIYREMGITLHTKRHMHPGLLPSKHTWARQAIRLVANQSEPRITRTETGRTIVRPAKAPESHVYDVLTLFLGSDHNSTQLYGDAILGVSEWLISQKVKSDEIPFLIDPFSMIKLADLREAVRHYQIPRKPQQLAFLIAAEMEEALENIRHEH